MFESIFLDVQSVIFGLSLISFYMLGWLSCIACTYARKKLKASARNGFNAVKLKLLKILYISVRSIARRFYAKCRIAKILYSWADLSIHKTCKNIYVLPGWLWRLVASVLLFIATTFRSKKLQAYIDKTIHYVPFAYRFPKMRPINSVTIGQDGKY